MITVLQNGKSSLVSAEIGENLLGVLVRCGYIINSPCGGRGTCNKCKAQLIDADFEVNTDKNGDFLLCKTVYGGNIELKLYDYKGSGLDSSAKHSFSYNTDGGDGFGIALDIGTTTLAAYLVNLCSGNTVCKASRLNPQQSMGADVLSRIKYASDGGLARINSSIINATNQMISQLCEQSGVKACCLTVTGNTTMLHLFANISPEKMGRAPFTAEFLEDKIFSGAELGIDIDTVFLMPSASAFVGGDIVAGVVAVDMDSSHGCDLLVDIGTNGEMVLVKEGELYSCSTAAGPAFEGANIACGLGGVDGAIDSIGLENGEIVYTTIGGCDAVGICGSGLISLIRLLVESGIIEESGSFSEDSGGELAKRLTDDRFMITDNVYLTQKDIREVQLAKSAINAGVQTLLNAANTSAAAVDNVYIAGGFGFYADIAACCKIGLLPTEFATKVSQVGNTAGSGCTMYMLSAELRERGKAVAKSIKNVDLASSVFFNEKYVENMFF